MPPCRCLADGDLTTREFDDLCARIEDYYCLATGVRARAPAARVVLRLATSGPAAYGHEGESLSEQWDARAQRGAGGRVRHPPGRRELSTRRPTTAELHRLPCDAEPSLHRAFASGQKMAPRAIVLGVHRSTRGGAWSPPPAPGPATSAGVRRVRVTIASIRTIRSVVVPCHLVQYRDGVGHHLRSVMLLVRHGLGRPAPPGSGLPAPARASRPLRVHVCPRSPACAFPAPRFPAAGPCLADPTDGSPCRGVPPPAVPGGRGCAPLLRPGLRAMGWLRVGVVVAGSAPVVCGLPIQPGCGLPGLALYVEPNQENGAPRDPQGKETRT